MNQLLVALTALTAFGYASAQSVDAPANVCTNQNFEVEWVGPNGAGDSITIAAPGAPADQALNGSSTNAGNPAMLSAPGGAGAYEVRYVQGAPRNILARQAIVVTDCPTGSGQSGAASGSDSTTDTAASSGDVPGSGTSRGGDGFEIPPNADKAVLVWGIQTNYGDVVNQQGPFGNFNPTIDSLCENADTIGWALSTIVETMEQAAYDEGLPISFDRFEFTFPEAPSRASIAANLRTVREEVCNREDKPPEVQPFGIMYAHCRMTMVTPGQVMDIHLPLTIGEGTMTAADYAKSEGIQMKLRRSIEDVTSVIGRGWASNVSMTSPASGGPRIGYPTTRYTFSYSGGPGGGANPIANMVSTENSGTVWVSDDVPGLDIVRSFYRNLTTEVTPDQGGMSFFSGLINNLVGLLRNGLPLEIDQKISSKIMGRTTVSGRSHSIVTGVELTDLNPEFCSWSLIADEIQIQDIDQQISEAMSQSGTSSQEMNDAMEEYRQSMEQMTPEERQLLEQYGMGDMMQQMMGGANPAAQQPSRAAAAGAATSGAAATRAGGSNMPPSEELNSGNLTESVQKHLQALGYDTGNVDGEMSMETTIAISTFQAEKGIKVTGEVSPQLLGILSAEVDRRRGN